MFEKKLQVGLGEAIKRLTALNHRIVRGIAIKVEKEEHDLLLDALNEIKIDLGFDCNEDGIPDSIEIFTKTANTSCCRLVSYQDSSRVKPKNNKRSSRRKKA